MGAKRARPAERKREAYRKRQNLGYSAVDVDFATALPSLPELFPELRCRETDNTHSWLHNCRIDPLVVSRTCLICKIDYATASSTPAQLLAPTSNVLELAQTLTHGSVALLSEADQLAEAYVVLGPPATQAEWHQFVEAAKGKSVIMLIGTAFEWSLDKGVMLEWDNSSAGSEGCQTSKRTANCRPFNADLYHQRLASAVGLHWLNVYEQHGLTPELLRKPWMYSQDLAQQVQFHLLLGTIKVIMYCQAINLCRWIAVHHLYDAEAEEVLH